MYKRYYSVFPLIYQKLFWIPARLIFGFFGRLEIYGLENLDEVKGNVIFASNHSSEIDPIFVPLTLSLFSRFPPILYASREKGHYKQSGWRHIFYGGTIFKILGSFPVFSGLHDYEKSLVIHVDILHKGGNICFYPEGGITKDGNLQPAHGGIVFLSYKTMTPIVPVYVSGAYHFKMSDFFMRRKKLSVSYGKVIYPRTDQDISIISAEDLKVKAQGVMDEIGKLRDLIQIK